MTLHLPVLRYGQPYESLDKHELRDYRTGELVALMSKANSGLIARDFLKIEETFNRLQSELTVAQAIDMCKQAAKHFMEDTLPVGDGEQSADDFVRLQSATTGMPEAMCRANMKKIEAMLLKVDLVLAGLTGGLDLSILDQGYGEQDGRGVSYQAQAHNLGVVLPNNSPGVHSLWIPAAALKIPLMLKPGSQEPWTPMRIIQSLIQAGYPEWAFGYYPAEHDGGNTILMKSGRAMVFGDVSTVRRWENDPAVEVHGPGWSKTLITADTLAQAKGPAEIVEIAAQSIAANGGRSCINCSAVWIEKGAPAREFAEALAERLAQIKPLPGDDPDAILSPFSAHAMAEWMESSIVQGLDGGGAVDLTEPHREGPRMIEIHGGIYMQPTLIWCDSIDHPLANKEFLFPYASCFEATREQMLTEIGPTLVASAITADDAFADQLVECPSIDRLNVGPISTVELSWDQPHEGNLFDHLYRQRAFQRRSFRETATV